ncbi:21991_t:CDS:2, partial [Dentiscutata erythropus]
MSYGGFTSSLIPLLLSSMQQEAFYKIISESKLIRSFAQTEMPLLQNSPILSAIEQLLIVVNHLSLPTDKKIHLEEELNKVPVFGIQVAGGTLACWVMTMPFGAFYFVQHLTSVQIPMNREQSSLTEFMNELWKLRATLRNYVHVLNEIIEKVDSSLYNIAICSSQAREDVPLYDGELGIKTNKHLSGSSPPSPVVQKIAYNQKIEQGIIQELILFIQKGASTSNEVVADNSGRDLAQLFSDAEVTEGKTIEAKQKELIYWYIYRESYQNKVAEIRSKTGVAEKTAKSQVYAIIKAFLPKVSKMNLRKKTQRAGSVYKLFGKIIDPTTKKEVKGIGIDKAYGISYGVR